MKHLTYNELLDAPEKVQYLYFMAMTNNPVGVKIFEEAIAEHPEYFPDEIKLKDKWSKVPQSVQDEYWVEREKIREQCYKEMPPSKGVLGWAENPQEFEEWQRSYEKCKKVEEPLAIALFKRFYDKYGIEWNGW